MKILKTMNEKAMLSLQTAKLLLMIICIVGILSLVLVVKHDQYKFKDYAETKCEELNLELFDYEPYKIFTESSITCWNSETKEIRRIK